MVLALIAGISMAQGVRNALRVSQDFQWDAAKALMLGMNPYAISLSESGRPDTEGVPGGEALDEFYRSFESIDAPQRMEANQFPSLLFLLFPMALLPWRAARYLWMLLNLFFTGGILFLLRKLYFRSWENADYLLLMLLLVSGTPWRNQMGVGQHTLFSLFFFLAALYADEKLGGAPGQEGTRDAGKRLLSVLAVSVLLAVSYFKYTLTAPLAVLFLYRKRWGAFFLSIFYHAAGTFAAARLLKEPFMEMIRQPLQVASALSGEGSIDLGAVFHGASWTLIITGVIMLLLAAAALILPAGHETELFTLAVLLSLVMTYHRSYDFFVLLCAGAGVFLPKPDRWGFFLKCAWFTLVFYLFFGLRAFSENQASLVLAGVFYYSFLLLYIVLTVPGIVRPLRGERNG